MTTLLYVKVAINSISSKDSAEEHVMHSRKDNIELIIIGENISSGFLMSTISSFESRGNKHDVYRGKDWMKKFCGTLREHAMEIINFKKKKIKLLTNEQQESYESAKNCYISDEKLKDKHAKDKKYRKVSVYFHYTGAIHSICNLKYNELKEISTVFNNGSNYDYHFIIKELAEVFDRQFTSLGENTEKNLSSSDRNRSCKN